MPIRRLPPLVVNQIAAGEVIERPASVVKELVENAIDAGATRIAVAIEAGGRELIRVTDDGCGMAPDQLPLALAAHATSKIQSAADLDAIGTLGFRGEALASIAAVSRTSILSRPGSEPAAAMIQAEGDLVQSPRPAPGPPGTCVTVRNLFFNTPARRKFLRTEPTETGRIADVVQALALSHAHVGFTLQVDGRSVLDLTAGQEARQRVIDVLGPELADELLDVRADAGAISIWGLAGHPSLARSSTRHQRVYLNGRPIADRSINHAIKEAYRGLIEPAMWPTIALFLRLPSMQVDVNVHPTKAEVRFRNQAAVHGAVLSAVRGALRAADLAPQADLSRAIGPMPLTGAWGEPSGAGSGLRSESGAAVAQSTAAFVNYFRRLDPVQKGFVYSEVKQALAHEHPDLALDDDAAAPSLGEDATMPVIRPAVDVLQVHSSYIVTQDEHGLLIIDQHALHERVMFEKLMAQVRQGNLESQRLLMPAVVSVDRAHLDRLADVQPLLARIGIEAEPFGPSSIAVHAFSSFLFNRNVEPEPFLRELLDRTVEQGLGDNAEAALHETLDMMACKAAVKAGDRLAPSELAELLRLRETVERSSNCPHGRPTTLRLSLKDLERQFGRT